MSMPPKQVPAETEDTFAEWEDWCLPDKSEIFEYSDSTRDHIDEGESQHFHYEGNDLPDKE